MQNIDAPILQPDLPNYPIVDQLARVTSPSIGSNIYPAIIVQYDGVSAFRDRTLCYVTEPNGVSLSPSIYDCRVVGSHLGLPLLATSCCVSGGFSSSSLG